MPSSPSCAAIVCQNHVARITGRRYSANTDAADGGFPTRSEEDDGCDNDSDTGSDGITGGSDGGGNGAGSERMDDGSGGRSRFGLEPSCC